MLEILIGIVLSIVGAWIVIDEAKAIVRRNKYSIPLAIVEAIVALTMALLVPYILYKSVIDILVLLGYNITIS